MFVLVGAIVFAVVWIFMLTEYFKILRHSIGLALAALVKLCLP